MISTKFQNFGTSIFAEVVQWVKETNAVNLASGVPEFDCPGKLSELACKWIGKAKNQYAPMGGLMALRESLAVHFESQYKHSYCPEKEISITCGATEALFTAITATVKDGDEVIVFDPAFDVYVPAIEMSGGKAIHLKLKHPDYHIDWTEVQKTINARTRMIILNNPHNPTGSVLKNEDFMELQRIINGTNVLVLSDEVYEHIIFDGLRHQSLAEFPELAKRSIVIGSLSKTFNATGWKVGYCCAPEIISAEFKKVHQFVVYTINAPAQYAINDFMKRKNPYQAICDDYQRRRDLFNDLIADSGFKILKSKSTYFELLDYSQLSDKNDMEFARELAEKYKVAAIPVSAFYNDHHDEKVLRFCFAKKEETLEKAARKLRKIKG